MFSDLFDGMRPNVSMEFILMRAMFGASVVNSFSSFNRFHFNEDFFQSVTIWEAYTKGALPYSYLNKGKHIVKFICLGGRLMQPSNCPDEIYGKLLDCWNKIGRKRPNFSELRKFFQTYAPIYSNVEILVL